MMLNVLCILLLKDRENERRAEALTDEYYRRDVRNDHTPLWLISWYPTSDP